MMAGDIARRPGWLDHDQAAAGRTAVRLALWRAVHNHDVGLSARRHFCGAFDPGFIHREVYFTGMWLTQQRAKSNGRSDFGHLLLTSSTRCVSVLPFEVNLFSM
jgi:hypothetical protein